MAMQGRYAQGDSDVILFHVSMSAVFLRHFVGGMPKKIFYCAIVLLKAYTLCNL